MVDEREPHFTPFAVGSQHRLPPPFGFARNGTFAWVANGQIVTTDLGSTKPRQLTSGDPTFNRPAFSRDGTKLAYERFTTVDQTSGDVIFAAIVLLWGVSRGGTIAGKTA